METYEEVLFFFLLPVIVLLVGGMLACGAVEKCQAHPVLIEEKENVRDTQKPWNHTRP